jgi:hypothetical protein
VGNLLTQEQQVLDHKQLAIKGAGGLRDLTPSSLQQSGGRWGVGDKKHNVSYPIC